MSASFTNVCNVGTVSTATNKLVEQQSRIYSVSTATIELVELLGKMQKADLFAGNSYVIYVM